jgi:hydroxymethylbilane synthase
LTGDLRIGSRGSALAIAQAELVRDALATRGRPASIVVIETAGDRRAPDTAWGEGAFVAAIELGLLEDRVDVAVHSAKDIPTDPDPRLVIGAYLRRADARDALVVRQGARERRIADLPVGARVGTDSPRRTGFLRSHRPDLYIHPLHGNVDTRLRRLDAGDTDALVLACAGLDRLGLSHRIAERLDPAVIPPAPGQGAIAVQVRSSDAETMRIVAAIDHRATRLAVETERAFLRATGGGCRAPTGAFATLKMEEVQLLGGHARPDGSDVVFGRRSGPVDDRASLGPALAFDLGLFGGSDLGDGLPVHGRPRVIVTRPAAQSADLMAALRAVGVEPLPVPAIEVELTGPGDGIDAVARRLNSYRWVVVTSANGAGALLKAAERVFTPLETSRFAAIGSSTRAVLEREGIEVDFVPDEPNGAALARELPVAANDRVAVIRGDLAGESLAARLRERGAEVDDIVAYRTLEAPPGSARLLRAAVDGGRIEAVLLTSGSTARGLAALVQRESLDLADLPAVCIGAETARVAAACGFHVLAVSSSPDPRTLASATLDALAPRLQEIR